MFFKALILTGSVFYSVASLAWPLTHVPVKEAEVVFDTKIPVQGSPAMIISIHDNDAAKAIYEALDTKEVKFGEGMYQKDLGKLYLCTKEKLKNKYVYGCSFEIEKLSCE